MNSLLHILELLFRRKPAQRESEFLGYEAFSRKDPAAVTAPKPAGPPEMQRGKSAWSPSGRSRRLLQ